MPLAGRQLDVLLILTTHAGQIVPKDLLDRAVWKGVEVTDNSIEKAVSGLRQTLGRQANGKPYIENVPRKGYRFIAPVERVDSERPLVSVDTALEPFEPFVNGRAALETLDRQVIRGARRAYAETLLVEPHASAAHIGLANACVLAFESTRADTEPDRAALAEAEQHAREACERDPWSAEAWGTLAVVRYRSGARDDAIKAARKAVTLAPLEWRHYLRLAFVSWGVERLAAAQRALALRPLAFGYWLAATVFVAREDFDTALPLIRAGCIAQDARQTDAQPFPAVGLHLLHGLVLAARGDAQGAREEWRKELTFESTGHVHARESCANAWYAMGALWLREHHLDEACAAFQEALTRVPGHALAVAGLAFASRDETDVIRAQGAGTDAVSAEGTGQRATLHASAIETAIAQAATLALQGRHDEAARVYKEALVRTEPSQAGWQLPVEPLLHANAHREAWADTLAILRDRAA
jgi:DNA-binding winged helix-turn-helix (wHTH) protein